MGKKISKEIRKRRHLASLGAHYDADELGYPIQHGKGKCIPLSDLRALIKAYQWWMKESEIEGEEGESDVEKATKTFEKEIKKIERKLRELEK